MKKALCTLALALVTLMAIAQKYIPSPENLAAREEFRNAKLGIFLHWGIYSTYAQGEWYLQNYVPDRMEYAKAADTFYPHRFDAHQWIKAFKDAGARYVCFTTRHHDGFSMWDTQLSDYNIVKATPRDMRDDERHVGLQGCGPELQVGRRYHPSACQHLGKRCQPATQYRSAAQW